MTFVRVGYNPEILSLGIPATFANPESRDWQYPNPGISGL